MAAGRILWSSFSFISTSPAIAFRCGSDVPEQITKKSVKLEIPRRSRTMMSSAFLLEASSAQTRASGSESISIPPDRDAAPESVPPQLAEPNTESRRWSQPCFEFPWRRCRFAAPHSDIRVRSAFPRVAKPQTSPSFVKRQSRARSEVAADCRRRLDRTTEPRDVFWRLVQSLQWCRTVAADAARYRRLRSALLRQ